MTAASLLQRRCLYASPNVIVLSHILFNVPAHAVTRRHLTAEVRLRFRTRKVGFVVEKVEFQLFHAYRQADRRTEEQS